jgi:hypothetical protein
MKLYTEKQLKELLSNMLLTTKQVVSIFEELTPIEIPSDDIIKEAANGNIDGYNGAMWLKYNYIIKNKS